MKAILKAGPTEIGHGGHGLPPHCNAQHILSPFLVSAHIVGISGCGTVHSFFVMAKDQSWAINLVRRNAANVIESMAEEATDEDHKKLPVYDSVEVCPVPGLESKLEALRLDLAFLDDEFDHNNGESEVAACHRETIKSEIEQLEKDIKQQAVPVGHVSRFEHRIRIMTGLLATDTVFVASALSYDRVYPVSHFDDVRSVISS